MRKSSIKVLVWAAALAAASAQAGDSAPFALDTRSGTRIARDTEPIAYSTAWNRGADVQVSVDGVPLKEAAAPATGTVGWNAAEAGIGVHTLTHVSGGVTLTAEFVVWGTKTTCEFRTVSADGRTEESPLGHHVQILFDDGAETPWHRGWEAVDLKPGWHSLTVRVDEGYEEQVTDWEPAFPSWLEWEWDIESSSKKVKFNIRGEYQGLLWDGEDTYSSWKLAVLLKSPAEHGWVRFACRGEITELQRRMCPDFPDFDLNKVVICIQKKTSETTGGAWIDAEPWGTGMPLLPGTYRVEFGYLDSYWGRGEDLNAPGVDLPSDVQGEGHCSTKGFLFEVKEGETTVIPVCYRPFGNHGLFVLVKFDGKGGMPRVKESRYLFTDDENGMGWSAGSEPTWPNAEHPDGWQLRGWQADSGYFMKNLSELEEYLKRTKVSLTLEACWSKTTVADGQTWQYNAEGGTATVVDGPKNVAVTIPATLDGLTVTAVGSWAFAEQVGLLVLTVPNSVEDIGEQAFSGCSGLTSVSLGNGVISIGDKAFANCTSLTSLTIPASVAVMGSQVFTGCSSLATIYVPAEWEGTDMLANAGVPEGCEIVYGGAAVPQTVWRFYSKKYKGHFFTISEAEKEDLIAHNPSWKFEGGAYRAYTNAVAGTTALYRFYSKGYKGHFFTIDEAEKDTIIASNPNWKYEGIAYYVYPKEVAGSLPVYRFWSKTYKHHFYTTSAAERDNLIATNPNWKYETVAFWALPLEEAAVARGRAVKSEKRNVKSERETGGEMEDGETGTQGRLDAGTRVGGGVVVTTSDGSDGSAVADGDEETGWSPEGAGGAWIALSYAEPVAVKSVDVAGENLPEGLRVLWSEDAEAWAEEVPMAARYVWVALPGGENVPVVKEILVAP